MVDSVINCNAVVISIISTSIDDWVSIRLLSSLLLRQIITDITSLVNVYVGMNIIFITVLVSVALSIAVSQIATSTGMLRHDSCVYVYIYIHIYVERERESI